MTDSVTKKMGQLQITKCKTFGDLPTELRLEIISKMTDADIERCYPNLTSRELATIHNLKVARWGFPPKTKYSTIMKAKSNTLSKCNNEAFWQEKLWLIYGSKAKRLSTWKATYARAELWHDGKFMKFLNVLAKDFSGETGEDILHGTEWEGQDCVKILRWLVQLTIDHTKYSKTSVIATSARAKPL